MQPLLQAFRGSLKEKKLLQEVLFNEDELIIHKNSIEYKNIQAGKVIYADGIHAAQSRFWKNLPFVQNKGQALVIHVEGLNAGYVYKFGHLTLIPLKEDQWWVGSSNELNFNTDEPTEDFKIRTVAALQSILKKEFTVINHWSALRPATVERRPFVGFHPQYTNMGILNGMGSKGCSLAPWFAKQLAENMVHENPIDVTANVQRFSRVLSH